MTLLSSNSTPGGSTVRRAYDGPGFRRSLTLAREVTEADWRLALEVARQNSTTELKAVLDLGLMGEEALADRLASFSGCPRWRAADESSPLSSAVPVDFMSANALLVLDEASVADGAGAGGGPGSARLVVADPSDHFAISSLEARFPGAAVSIGTQKEILRFIEEQRSAPAPGSGDRPDEALDVTGELSALRDMASEAPVVRFFNQMVERAMDLGASDIHLERFDRRVSLRFRVDGLLTEQPPPPMKLYEPILCRIKIMGSLDIAERRRAQDGRVRMRLRGRNVDLRVSIVPTMYGQDAAIRLQDRQKLADIQLSDLGFSAGHIRQLTAVAQKSHGILLITGPTGSGKTTTLYALLRTLVGTERKIVTVEDPVEYAMDGVNQIPVNPAINLTFGNTLRHILRHDPDVILIGEIRDKETAEIAFQASLTGHMVLSTLHTNDVPGTFVRLVDMGVEPYLVNAAVEGVSAQRLVRKRCTACLNQPPARDGCGVCGGLGYRGRVAIMEYSGLTGAVKQEILGGGDERRLRARLVESGFHSLRDDARRLVDTGVTDEAEIVRVLGAATLDLADELPHGAEA